VCDVNDCDLKDSDDHWAVVVGRPPREWRDKVEESGGILLQGSFTSGAQKHFFLEVCETDMYV